MRLLPTLLLSSLALTATLAQADTIKVLTTGAFKQVVVALVPGFEARTGRKAGAGRITAGCDLSEQHWERGR